MSFSSPDLPGDVSFTDRGDGSGILVWDTDHTSAGEYTAIFTASDLEFDVELQIPITINDINQPPVWDNVPAQQSIDENEAWTIDIQASDVDEDELTLGYSSPDLPEEFSFEDHGDGTATVSWTPGYEDAGSYEATFTANDGHYETTTRMTINVNNVNRAPVWDEYPEEVPVNEEEIVDFDVVGHDPVSYTHLTLPTN